MAMIAKYRILILSLILTAFGSGVNGVEPPPRLAWQVITHATPGIMWAGQTIEVKLRLKNVGSETWSSAQGDCLSYHLRNLDGSVFFWDGLRTSLPHAVKPQEEVDLVAQVLTPRESRQLQLEWDMVREGVQWYGPPLGQQKSIFPIRVMWKQGLISIGFIVLSLLGALCWRKYSIKIGAHLWWLRAFLPMIWGVFAIALEASVFSGVTGVPFWGAEGWPTLSAAVFLVLPIGLLPIRWRGWAVLTEVGCITLLLVADVLYLRFFGAIIPLGALTAVGQLGQIDSSIVSLMGRVDLMHLGGLVGVMILILLAPQSEKLAPPPNPIRRRVVWTVAIVCAAIAYPAFLTGAQVLGDTDGNNKVFSLHAQASMWGIGPAHLADLARSARSLHRPLLTAERKRHIAETFAAKAASSPEGPWLGSCRGANLILIQAESLQEFVIGLKINNQEVTPFLNSLRKNSAYFSQVFDQTSHGRSSDGEFVTLNSLLPSPSGAAVFLFAQNHFVALPKVLHDQGYETLSAHAFDRGFWNRAMLHPRLGFSRSMFKREIGEGEYIGWGLADGVFFYRMENEILKLKEPFFAFLITLGLHHPFAEFPANHKIMEVGRLKNTPLGNYLHSMRYLDDSIASFYNALSTTGIMKNTIFVIYGDHDAGFIPDQTLVEVAGLGSWDDTQWIRFRRVPLFISLPQGRFAGDYPFIGGQVDIAPTLLAALGIPRPKSFFGSPLVPGRKTITHLPYEGSTDGTLCYAPFVDANRPDHRCFRLATGEFRPARECAALQAQADAERAAAQAVLEYDLHVDLAEGKLENQ